MCLKTYTKLNGRVGFSLKIIIAILLRVCFMRKLTLNISNRPIPVLAVPYAKIISSNWQQINALSLYCIISCCISIGDCMKSTFSDRELNVHFVHSLLWYGLKIRRCDWWLKTGNDKMKWRFDTKIFFVIRDVFPRTILDCISIETKEIVRNFIF